MFVKPSGSGLPSRFNIQLKIATRLVERDQHAGLDMLAVFQPPAQQLRTVAEHHATYLRAFVLEREINVAGGSLRQVGNLTGNPAQRKRRLQPFPRQAVEH